MKQREKSVPSAVTVFFITCRKLRFGILSFVIEISCDRSVKRNCFSALCIAPNLRHVIMRSAGPDPYTYSRQSDEHLSHSFCTVDANQLESIFCAEQAATKL
jgi:hypothetical protein